jgi:spore coat polysaccharide biosynthesis protein SpsF (cytidylyltransferase family)/glycosyltransferase involved in cell wall biosynthesis
VKILYFSQDYTVHDLRFLSALSETDHTVFYLRLESTSIDLPPIPQGIVQLKLDIGGAAPGDMVVLREPLTQILNEIQPDLVHAGPVQQSAYLTSLTEYNPLLTMSWGSDMLIDAKSGEGREAAIYTLNRSTLFLCDCETVAEVARSLGMPDDRIVIFPWGVHLDHFSRPITSHFRDQLGWAENFVLISTRDLKPHYGVDVLVQGFLSAAEKNPRLRLLLLGQGPMDDELRERAASAGMTERVHFAGRIASEKMPDYFHAADLYVSASRVDGSSISLLQSMASGIPSLVSDIPGNKEWVDHGVNGWLFSVGSSDALASGLDFVYQNASTLPKVGKQARLIAEARADWRVNFQLLLDAYNLAIEKPRVISGLPKVVAVIQARMNSTRLPGKVLTEVAGVPMLTHVISRVQQAKSVDDTVVATTDDRDDELIVNYCSRNDVAYVRGPNQDVLRRTLIAAQTHDADVIVRITGDCPLIDPNVIDKTVKAFLDQYPQIDFGSNRGSTGLARTYPIGMDVEVMTVQALQRADLEAKESYQREHVTPYLYEKEGRFRATSVDSGGDYGNLRWAVDTPEDLVFVRQIFERLSGRREFGWEDILAILEAEPGLSAINASVRQKSMKESE